MKLFSFLNIDRVVAGHKCVPVLVYFLYDLNGLLFAEDFVVEGNLILFFAVINFSYFEPSYYRLD